MDKIIEGKDLVNMRFVKDEEGRLIVYKSQCKFIPKNKDEYFFIDDCGTMNATTWSDAYYDNWRLKHLILFRTQEECRDYKWFLDKIDEYSHQFNEKEWEDDSLGKYHLIYDTDHECIFIDSCYYSKSTTTYFKEEDIHTFIDEVGETRIKRYLFDIWE